MPGAANAHLIEVTGAAIATLQAALEAFKGADAQQGAETPSKSDVIKAAERVRGEATKVGVMCGGGDAATLSPAAAESLLGGFEQSCVAFCAAARALASGERAGPTLRVSVRKLTASVVEPCSDLLRAVAAGDDVKRAVGRVWAACGAVPTAPLDDRAALFRALAGAMTSIKDAEREMCELEEEEAEAEEGSGSGDEDGQNERRRQQEQPSSSTPAAAAAADNNNDEGPGLDYYEAGPLAADERALVAAARGLTSACAAVVRALGRALLRGPPLDAATDADARDAWESLAYHANNLQRCIEDVGAAAYPPQDVGELLAAAESAATTATLMLDEAPDSANEGEGSAEDGGFDALAAAVEAAAARVAEAGAAAEAASAERG